MARKKEDKHKVTVKQRKLSSGRVTLYLDYWVNGNRKREGLNFGTFVPKSVHLKNALTKANEIALKRNLELVEGKTQIAVSKQTSIGILAYFNQFVEDYTRSDIRRTKACYSKFKDFMKDKDVSLFKFTKGQAKDFKDYLAARLKQDTTRNYFETFKKMLTKAVDHGLIKENPANNISVPTPKDVILKAVLDIEELKILEEIECGNNDVKKAFLVSCMTGVTLVDWQNMSWSNLQSNNGKTLLVFNRAKTGQIVKVGVNKTALKLLGTTQEKHKPIFEGLFNKTTGRKLSSNGVNKCLKNWVERAKIDKHITFYCARHTFGTLQASLGTNQNVIAKNMGQTTSRSTDKYVNHVDEAKLRATDGLGW